MSLERSIAIRYMRARRKERFISLITVISIVGVGLGVAALIVVLAVLAGFESTLKEKFLGLNSHIVVMKNGQGIENWSGIIEKIKTVPGVAGAGPFIYGQSLGTGPGGASGIMIKGLDPSLPLKDNHLENIQLSEDAMEFLAHPENLEAPPIILGRDLSYQLGLGIYDLVTVISPFGRITPLGARAPLNRTFQMIGTFHSGFYEYDANMAYLDLKEAQNLLALDRSQVTTIEVLVEDIYQAGRIRHQIIETLDEPDYWARDWMQMNISLFAALQLEQTAMFVILTLIVLVAAFNIVATLTMMVKAKVRDIAILKSMGATRRQIRRIFTIQGMTVGGGGALAGLIVGVGLCLLLKQYKFISLPPEVYLMDTLPVEMRALTIGATIAVTLIISFLATIYPASQASKLDPVEALRYE